MQRGVHHVGRRVRQAAGPHAGHCQEEAGRASQDGLARQLQPQEAPGTAATQNLLCYRTSRALDPDPDPAFQANLCYVTDRAVDPDPAFQVNSGSGPRVLMTKY